MIGSEKGGSEESGSLFFENFDVVYRFTVAASARQGIAHGLPIFTDDCAPVQDFAIEIPGVLKSSVVDALGSNCGILHSVTCYGTGLTLGADAVGPVRGHLSLGRFDDVMHADVIGRDGYGFTGGGWARAEAGFGYIEFPSS